MLATDTPGTEPVQVTRTASAFLHRLAVLSGWYGAYLALLWKHSP